MHFGILGPIRVTAIDGSTVDIGGPRQRRLLAALVVRIGTPVATDQLLEIVFEGEPPDGASTTIRTYVARLRKALREAEPDSGEMIETLRGAYRLHERAGEVDAAQFEYSIERARNQLLDREPGAAVVTLRTALELWRGTPLGDFAFEEWAQPDVSRLNELHTVALEQLNDALLGSDSADEVVAATRRQIEDHPLRERFRSQHLVALYRTGRQAEALRSLDSFEQALADVGLEPSEEIRRLGGSIAAHDPALRASAPSGRAFRGYRLGELIGQGANGTVYRALQPGVGREVAIKTLRSELADDLDFVRRFDTEAQVVANLSHPHIVPIYDYWREPGGAYIVMRLVDESLQDRLDLGPIPPADVATIAGQLGSALAAAHGAGIVHGDLKPSNVLADTAGVYLADFGISTLTDVVAPPSTPDGDVDSGHPSGIESPEQRAGEPPSPFSDQFSLAALLFTLLTGTLPFGRRGRVTEHDPLPSISAQRPSIPMAVDAALAKGVAWRPSDRYDSVESFVDEFVEALTGERRPHPERQEVDNPTAVCVPSMRPTARSSLAVWNW